MTAAFLIILLIALRGTSLCRPGTFNSRSASKDQTLQWEGLFTLLVVLAHYRNYITTGAPDTVYLAFQSHIGQSVVAVFLFWSGYGMMSALQAKGGAYLRRIPQKLGLLWLRYGAIVLLFALVRSLMGATFTLPRIGLALLAWSGIGNSDWYVFCMLCLYVLLFLAALPLQKKPCTTKRSVLVLTMLTLFTIAYVLIIRQLKPSWWYDTALLFPLGGWYTLLRKPLERFVTRSDTHYYASLAAAGLLYIVLCLHRGAHLAVYTGWTFAFMLLILLVSMKLTLHSSLLTFAGKHVFPIYMLQRLPMLVLQHMGLTASHPYISLYLTLCITMLMALAYDKVLSLFHRKPAPLPTEKTDAPS